MKRIPLLTIALLSTATISPASGFDLFKSTDNQESCIINGLQGVNNKTTAYAVFARCRESYLPYRQVGSRYALGRTGDWRSCVAEYGGSTSNNLVANMIRRACAGVNKRSLREICADLEPQEPQAEPADKSRNLGEKPNAASGLFDHLPSPQSIHESLLAECRLSGYL